MKEILTLNKIAKCGTDRFDSAKYICTDNAEDPAAIMALSPTVTPRRMVELEPTHTFLPNRIGAGYIAPRSSGAVP